MLVAIAASDDSRCDLPWFGRGASIMYTFHWITSVSRMSRSIFPICLSSMCHSNYSNYSFNEMKASEIKWNKMLSRNAVLCVARLFSCLLLYGVNVSVCECVLCVLHAIISCVSFGINRCELPTPMKSGIWKCRSDKLKSEISITKARRVWACAHHAKEVERIVNCANNSRDRNVNILLHYTNCIMNMPLERTGLRISQPAQSRRRAGSDKFQNAKRERALTKSKYSRRSRVKDAHYASPTRARYLWTTFQPNMHVWNGTMRKL